MAAELGSELIVAAESGGLCDRSNGQTVLGQQRLGSPHTRLHLKGLWSHPQAISKSLMQTASSDFQCSCDLFHRMRLREILGQH